PPRCVERIAAGAIRSRRDCGVGGKRLLLRSDEGERSARRNAYPPGRRRRFPADQLRPRDERSRRRSLPCRVAAHRRARCPEGCVIYLDYQATTPVAPEVAKAMHPWIEEKFANPHSPSKWGRAAEAAVEVARREVERTLGLEGGSIAFTGSATEAINWALKGTIEKASPKRNRIITVATEHAAVLDTCEWLAGRGVDLTVLPVGPNGMLDLDLLERELDERVAIVAV